MLTLKEYLENTRETSIIDYLSEQFILLENRIEFLKNNFEGKLNTDHDPHATAKSSAAIVDHFATKADPSAKKVHTQWILKQYQQGKVRQEDHPRINQALSDFDRYKPKLEKKDINQYGSVSEVEDAVAPHVGTATSKKAEVRQVKHEGADKVWEDDNISIHRIKTKEAACHYGRDTKWCTAAVDRETGKPSEHNMFDHYNNNGPLHVVTMKNERDENGRQRKFQYHTNSNQFMDEKDDEISREDFDKIKPSLHKAWREKPELLD